jgi:hypothetical protein
VVPEKGNSVGGDAVKVGGVDKNPACAGIVPAYRLEQLPRAHSVEFTLQGDVQIADAFPGVDAECLIRH